MSKIIFNGTKIKYKERVLVCDGKPLNKEIQKVNLMDFDLFARKHNLNYRLMFGTLLGAIRDSGFIAHDEDIDLGLVSSDFDKILNNLEELKKIGFEIVRYDERGLLSIMRNKEYIDLYFFKKEDDKWTTCNMFIYPSELFEETVDYEFLGFNVKVSAKFKEALLYEFGENWVTPIKYEHSKKGILFDKFKGHVKKVLPIKIKRYILNNLSKKTYKEYLNKYEKYQRRAEKNIIS